MGISPETIQKGINKLNIKNGRMESFTYEDKKIVLNLAKNPAGFNVSLDTMKKREEKKALAVFLNDTEHDGIDISWIWDADFEQIKEMNIDHVYCGGTRAEELALRLHYAGFNEGKISIEKNTEKLVDKAIDEHKIIFMIPNYTMLAPVRKNIIKKVGQK
jgi:UDP-N-acetylmuramyl tripeptide synthase